MKKINKKITKKAIDKSVKSNYKPKNKQEEIITEKFNIIDQYTVTGIPMGSVKAMCKELGIKEKDLMKYMYGQTMALVGNEGMLYPWDIKRFVRGLPCID